MIVSYPGVPINRYDVDQNIASCSTDICEDPLLEAVHRTIGLEGGRPIEDEVGVGLPPAAIRFVANRPRARRAVSSIAPTGSGSLGGDLSVQMNRGQIKN